ncbi:hypothetical protein PybrP1_007674 [[Pythium] brassicae (nom. inval.)]|nr:hypothetical protein PybrP1_007674 [[Pythium] brassicae (nom. inval.)]
MARRLRALLLAACCAAVASSTRALDVLSTPEQLERVESSSRLFALLAIAGDAAADTPSDALARAAHEKFPSLARLERELEGVVTFALVDAAAQHKALANRWNLPAPPALLVFADAPQQNPYTHKAYRNPLVVKAELLNQPTRLKKLLRDSVPAQYVTVLGAERVRTRADVEALVQEHTHDAATLVLLLSKQKKPSPLYRALAAEFHGRGLRFAIVSVSDDADAAALLAFFGVDAAPALLAIASPTQFTALPEDKMKTYADLKAFVAPLAATPEPTTDADAPTGQRKSAGAALTFVTASAFERDVLASNVVWVVAFTSSSAAVAAVEGSWQAAFDDAQKKAGMVGVAAVKCADEPALCATYGDAGVRVFPVALSPRGRLERAPVLPETFPDLASAVPVALATIPDQVQVLRSTAELNAFVSRAVAAKALPVVLFSAKSEPPPVLKAVALSLPAWNVAVGVVLGAAPEVKAQFSLPRTTATAFVCLVVRPADADAAVPEGASPFGVVKYDKKALGPYTYANMMRFLLSVLSEYPHPKLEGDDFAVDEPLGSGTDSADTLVPYLEQHNLPALCSGSVICAIGFFDAHAAALLDPESALSRAMRVLTQVAATSKQSREPFRFMWTNGRCQRAFAEAFGVGAFQMPTVVVYAPSKRRYAANVGTFTEENTRGFLQGVLSGKIGTAPVADVPGLRDECAPDEALDSAMGDAAVDDSSDDSADDDVLSEILADEQRTRALAAQQREADEQEAKKASKKKSKKASKKKKNKKKKTTSKRDEL